MITQHNIKALAPLLTGDTMFQLIAHWMIIQEQAIAREQLDTELRADQHDERRQCELIFTDPEYLANCASNVLSGIGLEEQVEAHLKVIAPSYVRPR